MHMLALLSLKQLHPATPRARRIVMLCLQRPSLLRQFEGQHLANLLWGLTRSGFRPLHCCMVYIQQGSPGRLCTE